MKLSHDLLAVLLSSVDEPLPVRDILQNYSDSAREEILIYLEMMISAGLISPAPSHYHDLKLCAANTKASQSRSVNLQSCL